MPTKNTANPAAGAACLSGFRLGQETVLSTRLSMQIESFIQTLGSVPGEVNWEMANSGRLLEVTGVRP
jgi:hypothetical protein